MAAGMRLLCLLSAVALHLVCGDVYMHNPRGSNNRLNERSANRQNANRMFDSQNNNRGGYNAGDPDTAGFNDGDSEDDIYYMKYFQSGEEVGADSALLIEWTNQHGCGGNQGNDPHKLNCNVVLQYMVQDYDGVSQDVTDTKKFTRLRNGVNTNTQTHNTPQDNENLAGYMQRRQNSVAADRGLHEVMDFYDDCTKRERNINLFTADQRLRGNTAQFTRQNPNGNRRGYECPEERDYYPYWHPTPWRDIAVLTDNTSTLCAMYKTESFNVQPRQHCRENFPDTEEARMWSAYNNQEECEENDGTWFTQYGYVDIDTDANLAQCQARNTTLPEGYSTMWARPSWAEPAQQCLILGPPPECDQVGWSRVNHLGNGRDGVPLNYTWRIPSFFGENKLAVVRIRYNISTDDYNPWQTNSSFNENLAAGIRSPVEQNPNVDIGSSTNKPLRLAINTAQFGRTFQDRTHVMELRPRDDIAAQARMGMIHNVNVRGKRGNIVQTYPSVEYDFIPNRLTINTGECIHFQWTGSNRHNNAAPGGDGQTGDAGEGTGGTDRHNIVEIPHPNSNYPLPVDKDTPLTAGTPVGAGMFKAATVAWASFDTQNPVNKQDLELAFASAGYYHCLDPVGTCSAESVQSKDQLQQLLNNAPASFEGAVLCFPETGVYYYISSRNNNFTNRSQKGMLTVKA